MDKQLWGGRFEGEIDPKAFAWNASFSIDQRLAEQDVRGSLAWSAALVKAGVLAPEEGRQIQGGLQQIRREFTSGNFPAIPSDEDVHTAVERRLGEIIGPLAGKLHTGRSRNDQVATDFRLWLLDHLPTIDAAIKDLQSALVFRAEADFEHPLPGYTHLQAAQPVLLAHWWLAHFWPLQRDRERLDGAARRTAIMPLGSGALAGTPFPIDRAGLAVDLGFDTPSPNSLDAVSDRDFAAEFLFFATMVGIHASKLAENIVIFSSREFGFFELADAYTTGSSLMPQKKNPDAFELARGKAGTLIGQLTGLLATLKGLPSTYDKDLQEDKPPVFRAVDTLLDMLPVLGGALRTLTPRIDRMRSAIDPLQFATGLADYLVSKGVAFRQAHHVVGQVVQFAEKTGVPLDRLPLKDYQQVHSAFEQDVFSVFDIQTNLARYQATGGTAPSAVRTQLEKAKSLLETNLSR